MPNEDDYTTILGSRSGHYGESGGGLTASWQIIEDSRLLGNAEEPMMTIDLSLISIVPQPQIEGVTLKA